MKNIKKYQPILLSICLLFPGAVILFLFYCFQSYMKNEIYLLLGFIYTDSADSAAIGESFKNYLNYIYNGGSDIDRAKVLANGQNIVSLSGYEFSASHIFSSHLAKTFFPVMFLLLLLFALMLLYVIKSFQQLTNANRLLEQKCMQKEQYIKNILSEKEQIYFNIDQYEGNLYHQLKTPVTSLQLCLEQLQEMIPEDLWKTANLQLQKLSRLITLFLRDQQVASNKIKFNYQISMLDTILLDAASQVMLLAKEKEIPFAFTIPDRNWEFACDEVWLGECLVTLLENAVEHSNEREIISVQMELVNGQYGIHITTHGKALDPRQLEHIFERYYSSKTNHFGIGLHMAMTIAKKHHGTIRTSSNPDRDSVTFSVVLPALNKSEVYELKMV